MESCLQTCADVLAHFTQLSRAVAQTSSETVFLALCYTHSAPSAAAAVPHKQLIILPITLVIGSSHSVLPQHLQLQWRGGESSFSLKRCNQTYNSQLTAAFFFLFYIHTHIWPVWTRSRDLSRCVKEGGKSVFTFLLFASSFRSWRRMKRENVAKVLPHEKLLPSLFSSINFLPQKRLQLLKKDGQMNNSEIFPIQVPRFSFSPSKTMKREKRWEEEDPNTHRWPREGEMLGELFVGCMFCTEPVSSCLCCSAFISNADLTGCDRASQERALQEYLKDATRSLQIWKAFQIFISQFIDSGGFFLVVGEGSCFQGRNRNKKK